MMNYCLLLLTMNELSSLLTTTTNYYYLFIVVKCQYDTDEPVLTSYLLKSTC